MPVYPHQIHAWHGIPLSPYHVPPPPQPQPQPQPPPQPQQQPPRDEETQEEWVDWWDYEDDEEWAR